jgi:arginyl-tRNA synthetase
MNIFKDVKLIIEESIKELFPDVNADTLNLIAVEIPKEAMRGDASTNAAMILARPLKLNPLAIANQLAEKFQSIDLFASCEVASPGFINFRFSQESLYKIINAIHKLRRNYGNMDLGCNKLINVEFVSANPTGPMHVGHSRSAIYGDVLCRLLTKCNYKVIKEYYVNDAGNQIDTLADSLFVRYQQLFNISAEIPEGGYPGEYLINAAQILQERYGDSLLQISASSRPDLLKEFAVQYMLSLIKKDLQSLGVEHDVFISEKVDIHDTNMIATTLELLAQKGLLYKGILEQPKGKTLEDWEPREQNLFKASLFGDESDRPLQKADGSYTYFAADIAYHLHKFKRGFNNMVLLLGADHGGYVKRMQAAVAAISDNQAQIDIKINQLVNLIKDGKPFKMSKRMGNFVTVQDLLAEISKEVLRFFMLSRKNDTVLDVDIDKAREQSKDNPYFYVQYAHARIQSLLRNAEEEKIFPELTHLNLLVSEPELQLIKKLAEYPKMIASACITHEPHRIVYYLIELATEFHAFWALGNENEALRWIVAENRSLSSARLALAQAIAITIASGLEVLGIETISRM